MKNMVVMDRAIKIIQAVVLIALGVIVCVLSGNVQFQQSIAYCVATVSLVFGLFSIAFAYLFSKGILSSDIIIGAFLIALGILVFVSPNIIYNFLPTFLGVLLMVYSIMLLIEAITSFINIKKVPRNLWRGLMYSLLFALLFVGAILMFVYREHANQWINIVVGALFIVGGFMLLLYIIFKPRLKKESKENTTVVPKEDVIDTTAEEEKSAPKKRNKKKIAKQEDIKELKEIKKDE